MPTSNSFPSSLAVILIPLVSQCLAQDAGATCQSSVDDSTYVAEAEYLGCEYSSFDSGLRQSPTDSSLGYNDSSVSILSDLKLSTVAMTPQYCANFCGERGYAYGGIEFTT